MNPTELAELLATALPDEHLTEHDVVRCCFGPDARAFGDRHAAAVVTVHAFENVNVAWILALAVHPDHRRQGRGGALVEACVDLALAAGATDLHLGNAAPRYVWPGVDFAFTPALALFEATGFEPYGASCNMALPTTFRAEPPNGTVVTREGSEGAVALARDAFPHWLDEVTRSTAAGTTFVARDGGDTVGFACHSANRDGWIGPMATDPDRRQAGTGSALLGAVCADLAERGVGVAEIAWVGPIGFYAKAGARVSRVFRNARRELS